MIKVEEFGALLDYYINTLSYLVEITWDYNEIFTSFVHTILTISIINVRWNQNQYLQGCNEKFIRNNLYIHI